MKVDVDGKFFQILLKIVDVLMLSGLWLLSCIPIITIGAASTALYYTVHKSIRQGRGYAVRNYVTAFKENFKQSTICWLIYLLIFLVLFVDISIVELYVMEHVAFFALYIFFLVMSAFVLVWAVYLFSYMARFGNTIKASLKNAAIFAGANLHWSILILAIMIVAYVLVFYVVPPVLIALPAIVCILYNRILERVFRKYMSEEDLQRELEQEQISLTI